MRKMILLCITAILAFTPVNVNAFDIYMETIGEAIPTEDGYLWVSGIGITNDAYDQVLLCIKEAQIFDLRTGFSISEQDIYEGDCVRVMYYLSPVTDTDVAHAVEVYVHAGETGSADFIVVASDNIWYSNGNCSFMTTDGKYRIIIDEETDILDEYGYELSWEEIEPGMEMFVWAAIVTASFPGQVVPDKIVLR